MRFSTYLVALGGEPVAAAVEKQRSSSSKRQSPAPLGSNNATTIVTKLRYNAAAGRSGSGNPACPELGSGYRTVPGTLQVATTIPGAAAPIPASQRPAGC